MRIGVANGSAGIAVAEVYDLDGNAPAKLANISSRGLVEAGGKVMIGGFIIGGPDEATVMVRALGPSLPVKNPLPDPFLELFNADGVRVAENSDWWGPYEGEAAEVRRTGIAPTNLKDAALVATLGPGAYTAVVSDIDGLSGIAVVEVYHLE